MRLVNIENAQSAKLFVDRAPQAAYLNHMKHLQHIWPKVSDLADDLGIPYTTAHSWAARGRIPASWDIDLIMAAEKRGKLLTLEYLAQMRHQQKEARRTQA